MCFIMLTMIFSLKSLKFDILIKKIPLFTIFGKKERSTFMFSNQVISFLSFVSSMFYVKNLKVYKPLSVNIHASETYIRWLYYEMYLLFNTRLIANWVSVKGKHSRCSKLIHYAHDKIPLRQYAVYAIVWISNIPWLNIYRLFWPTAWAKLTLTQEYSHHIS